MIEGITQIGQLLLGGDENRFLDLLIQNLPTERKNKRQHVVALDFRCGEQKLDFELLEEVDNESPYTYTWVGNASANDAQQRLSSSQIVYLISQSLPSLADALPKDSLLREQLGKILSMFFFDLGEVRGNQAKYRYILDPARAGIETEIDLEERALAVKDGALKPKDLAQEMAKEVEKHISETLQLSSAEIAIYTVCLNHRTTGTSLPIRSPPSSHQRVIAISAIERSLCRITWRSWTLSIT